MADFVASDIVKDYPTPTEPLRILDGVDLYVDSLDFFALEIRRKVFAACYARGVPAVTAAPLSARDGTTPCSIATFRRRPPPGATGPDGPAGCDGCSNATPPATWPRCAGTAGCPTPDP